jgi:hypothetical protein
MCGRNRNRNGGTVFFSFFLYHAQPEIVVSVYEAWCVGLRWIAESVLDDLRGLHSWRLGIGRQPGSHV